MLGGWSRGVYLIGAGMRESSRLSRHNDGEGPINLSDGSIERNGGGRQGNCVPGTADYENRKLFIKTYQFSSLKSKFKPLRCHRISPPPPPQNYICSSPLSFRAGFLTAIFFHSVEFVSPSPIVLETFYTTHQVFTLTF